MKRATRTTAAAAAALTALVITAIGASAAAQPADWATRSGPASPAGSEAAAPAYACAALEAGDVVWVTLDEDGEIAGDVESYPSETTKVTAAFEYSCIPRKTTITTVWSIDGEVVLTDETTPKATDKSDTWTSSLFMKDESPLPDGKYGIEYYIGEDRLTFGEVTVGGTEAPTAVTVRGVVQDSKSKKAIKGAMVIVLNEGVDPEAWLEEGTDDDVFSSAKTNSKGQFELDQPIPLGAELGWLIGAQGYKPIVETFALEEDTEDPLELTINLVKGK
jgi:hypothetical protein